MSIQVTAALISGLVALIIGITGSILTWLQFRRRWLSDTRTSVNIELYKKRLDSYPSAFIALAPLSHGSSGHDAVDTAQKVAKDLNTWLYSVGGMCADETTRGAILGLRNSCRRWTKDGRKPDELYKFRNAALQCLRLDLELPGLESYDFDNLSSFLSQIQRDVRTREGRANKSGVPSA